MRSAAQAFGWQMWGRHRWIAAALLAYGIGLAAAAHAPGAAQWRQAIFMSALPLEFGLLFFAAVFTYPEGDLLGRQSGFPARMLTLPVRTRTLVFWPALHGAMTVALCWIAFARLLMAPLGVPVPDGWPAVMIAALLVCLQALVWSPIALPYLRVVLAIVGLPLLVSLGINAALSGVSPGVLTGAFAGLAGLAYLAAVAGLDRARRGDCPEWHWLPQRSGRTAARDRVRRRGFATPAKAQLWFEWRGSALALPLVVTVLFLLVSLPLAWVRDLAPLEANPPRSPFGSLEVNLWLRLQQACLFAPPIFAAILGCGRRTYDARRKELTLHPFLATRPLDDSAFIAARLKVAALSTLLTWALVLLFGCGWLLLPAREGARTAPLLLLLRPHCPPPTALTVVLTVGILILWTWKNQIQGLFADLSGRAWIVYGVPVIAHGLALAAFIAVVQWSADQHELDLHRASVPGIVPWLLALAVALKVSGAVGALRALHRRGLASPAALARLVAAWAALALALFAALWWIAAAGAASSPMARIVTETYLPLCSQAVPDVIRSPGSLAAVAILFIPLTRLLAAPLTLAWNRRR